MKLTFIGAAHEVTGSCHLLEACGKRVLIDCGMEQGPDLYENQKLPVTAGEIDYVLLTHAHIDHTGLLPLLYRQGFRGKIYATSATTELCEIMLRDCAHIQEADAEWITRKHKRAGTDPVEPLFTMEDAEGVLKLFRPCHYGTTVDVADGIRIRFIDAGHLLGSASIEIWLNENGGSATVRSFGKMGLTDTARAIFGRWIASIPFCRVEERYIIVHAGISDRYDIDDIEAIAKLKRGRYETGSWFSDKKDFIWDRTYITAAIEYEEKGKTAKGARQPLETERTIFVGHTPLKAPFSSERYHLRAVDTGAGHPGGYLTLMDMDTGEWWKSQRWV